MTMRIMGAVAAAVMAWAGTAVAGDLLAAGGLYGGPGQVWAVCFVYNAGDTSLTLAGAKIVSESGAGAGNYPNSCNGSLAAGASCKVVGYSVFDTNAYACRVTVSPSKAAARGMLQLRDNQQRVLASVALR